jgi:hypothetical protein
MGQVAEALKTEIWNSRKNYFGIDNFDQHRSGNYSRIGAAVDLAKYVEKCITGLGSKVRIQPFDSQTCTTSSISVDDFVERNHTEKVDFIKMYTEGAEMLVLKGARKAIRKFRPKFAIATYHSLDNFDHIPYWISQLEEGYDVYVDHFTRHTEETICVLLSLGICKHYEIRTLQ